VAPSIRTRLLPDKGYKQRLRATLLIAFVALAVACRQDPPPAPAAMTTRALGTWEGRGSQTIGFNSESGRFRVTWQTRNEQPPGTGTFRLAAHSAVSGRPIQPIADHRGAGSGAANVDNDPRPYNLMIESTNVDWTISVEETIALPVPQRR
jgi:hypothetical protein